MLNKEQAAYLSKANKKGWFYLFKFLRLPSLWFWGVRIEAFNANACTTSVRLRWSSKNPFKSVYFAALVGSAELSTGLLVQMLTQGMGKVSMLVVAFESEFFKKATGRIYFQCTDGEFIRKQLEHIQKEGKGQFVTKSIGKNESGDTIGRFEITWSIYFKS